MMDGRDHRSKAAVSSAGTGPAEYAEPECPSVPLQGDLEESAAERRRLATLSLGSLPRSYGCRDRGGLPQMALARCPLLAGRSDGKRQQADDADFANPFFIAYGDVRFAQMADAV